MSTVISQNLKNYNISTKIITCIKKYDVGKDRCLNLKVNLNGQNTGYSVKVSKAFYYNEKAKEEVIRLLESAINRVIEFGTRHIYVGFKLV